MKRGHRNNGNPEIRNLQGTWIARIQPLREADKLGLQFACSSEIMTRRLSPQLRVYPCNPPIFRILDRCTCLQLFPTYTKHIRTIYIYIHNMYVSFPHKLSIYTSGWWFQTSFIFTPTWGKKIQFDYLIFFKMGWNHPIYTCTVYQYAAVFCFNKENRRVFFFCHFF